MLMRNLCIKGFDDDEMLLKIVNQSMFRHGMDLDCAAKKT